MPQIAQQDYLLVSISEPQNPTAEEKAELRKHVQNGTIFDVIILYDGAYNRVVGYTSGSVTFFSVTDAESIDVNYTE